MFHPTVRSSRPRIRAGLTALAGALLVLLAACGGGDNANAAESTTTSSTTTTSSSTTTTTEPPALSALTGLPVDDEAVLERPVIAAKISSDRAAQPQVGLSTADWVIEEVVEGGISRFLAVFQSTESDPVGPIRSARTSEVELLPLFGRPIFVHSGGNQGTIRALSASQTLSAGHNSAFGHLYYRDRSRRGPNNLFTDTSAIREAVGDDAAAPGELFRFLDRDDDPPHHALPVSGVDLSFGSTRTRWVWDADQGAFLRWQDGREHLDPDNFQLAFPTVVVLATRYQTSAADPRSPEAVSVGSGDAWVLSDGWVVAGTWERSTPDSPYVLRDPDGEEIALAPGRIWLALPRTGEGNIEFLDADPREEQ